VRGITVLLGNDLAGGRVIESPRVSEVPQMKFDKVSEKQISELFPACAVTRAMARARSSPKSPPEQKEVHPSEQLNLPDTFLRHSSVYPPTSDISDNLQLHEVNKVEVNNVLSRQDLIRAQESDPEIVSLTRFAVDEREAQIIPNCYFWKKGVLMRKWRPPMVPASEEWKVLYQIVLPRKYRHYVLSLAHETPMAGHLGVKKTYCKVLNHYYWPGVHRDVKSFIRVCHICQMVHGQTQSEATRCSFKTHPSVR